jgi:hypothetical protein
MIEINKKEDIYPAINELIYFFEQNDKEEISGILRHRMFKVSWTSQSELFEELSSVLKNIIKKNNKTFDEIIVNQIDKIIKMIQRS